MMTVESQQTGTKITPRTGWGQRWMWVIVAIVVLLILLFLNAPSIQNGSTYSLAPKGYRSWYEYMVEQGHPVERWRKSYNQLPESNQTLIQIAARMDQNRDNREGWLDLNPWVEQGNTLIILTWDGTVSAAPFSHELTSSVGPVRVETTRRHPLQANQKSELQDKYGSVVWSQTVGKGQVILATYPWIGANVYADQPGNYRFLEQLVLSTDRKLWVDEYLHGHREQAKSNTNTHDGDTAPLEDKRQPKNLWLYLAQTPVAAVAAQLMLLAMLGIWGHNHRFGLPLHLPKESKDNSQRYIQALAGTLNYAHQRKWVLTQLSQYLRQTLADRLGLRGRTETQLPADDILASQWAVATGRNEQDLLELLQKVVQQPPRSDRDLLVWLNKADAILQDIS